MSTAYLIGTCDTKAVELAYVRDQLQTAGKTAIAQFSRGPLRAVFGRTGIGAATPQLASSLVWLAFFLTILLVITQRDV